uniref:Uncharacterized protein n=1 Tax=Gopherus evgoodei TaxID=1825980 RepID=A0A8C4YPS7_9SAUR
MFAHLKCQMIWSCPGFIIKTQENSFLYNGLIHHKILCQPLRGKGSSWWPKKMYVSAIVLYSLCHIILTHYPKCFHMTDPSCANAILRSQKSLAVRKKPGRASIDSKARRGFSDHLVGSTLRLWGATLVAHSMR